MVLAASIPTKTGVLTLRRAISEAPSAQTSGVRPAMNAMEVIITARNRSLAPSSAASRMPMPLLSLVLGELHDQDRVLGRHRDQHHEPDLAIEIERQFSTRIPAKAPSTPVITDNRTGTGIIQLS